MSAFGRTGGFDGGGFTRVRFFSTLFPPVIKWLLIINVSVWLLLDIFLAPFTIGGVALGGTRGIIGFYLSLWPLGSEFWPWQLLTYMFLHGGFFHLFFNMVGIWMFGMELEAIWGSRKFLTYYLLCGLGAGVFNLLVAPLLGPGYPTVGASGAVFGILIAFAMLFPNRPIYIYFLLPVPAKYLIAGFIVLELFYGVLGTTDGVAHFVHLGGAAVGLLYMLAEKRVLPVGSWWERFPGGLKNPFAKEKPYLWRDGQKVEVQDARFQDLRRETGRDHQARVTQEEIDAILDKISKGGYQSLTEKEKQMLNEASKHIH